MRFQESKAKVERLLHAERFDWSAMESRRLDEDPTLPASPRLIGVFSRHLEWRGSSLLVDGIKAGWADLVRFAELEVAGLAQSGVRDPSACQDGAVKLLLLESLWDSARFERFGIALRDYLETVNGVTRDILHFAFFASWIHEVGAGRTPLSGAPASPLAALSRAALQPTIPTVVLEASCEFQVEAALEPLGELSSLRLVPCWWFALRTLRTRHGLETPKPHHPLFETPFSVAPILADVLRARVGSRDVH